jgi:hypothetical protein
MDLSLLKVMSTKIGQRSKNHEYPILTETLHQFYPGSSYSPPLLRNFRFDKTPIGEGSFARIFKICDSKNREYALKLFHTSEEDVWDNLQERLEIIENIKRNVLSKKKYSRIDYLLLQS